MKWQDLLFLIGSEPIFSSTFLMAGNRSRADIQLQLSRWVKAGKLHQLKRGLYVLAEPYRKVSPHPFLIANRMKNASYVSLQSALAWYDLIPEYVPVVTSVTTNRTDTFHSSEGSFLYRHIKKSMFTGYRYTELLDGQFVFLAQPEKALLDLIYLTSHSESRDYLKGLRLQNMGVINTDLLVELSIASGSPRLKLAANRLIHLIYEEGV
ncbi:MAG: type IV toxin-antitoxin system AbiEi family antitoxin domain-containing protein [Spirochaetaceae bacterium]|nr:type IV toxin-antitoxin system AbiEi family antitoxin domain-containing protein [Spirochaetaceae bacterium]